MILSCDADPGQVSQILQGAQESCLLETIYALAAQSAAAHIETERNSTMDVFALLFYPIALFLGLFIALRQKKDPGILYTGLDKVSIVLNVILIPVYAVYSFMPMILGMIIFPTSSANAWQCVVSWLLSGVIAASPVYCAIALGLSVSYRRRGLSKKGFLVQFAGIPGIVIPVLIGAATDFISVPWMNTSLN